MAVVGLRLVLPQPSAGFGTAIPADLLLGQRAGAHFEIVPPVAGPSCLRLSLIQWLFLTISHGLQAIRRNSETDQEPLGGCRAPNTERQIVLVRPSSIGVSLDPECQPGSGAKNLSLGYQGLPSGRSEVRLVESKVDPLLQDCPSSIPGKVLRDALR